MSRKRANNEGTLFYRKDRNCWVAQVTIGRTPSGRIRRKTFYGKTQEEALQKKKQFEAELTLDEQHPLLEDEESVEEALTLNDVLDLWLDSIDVSYKTLSDYESLAKNHIRPTLGKKMMLDITPLDVQRLHIRKRKEGYSPRTVQYIHTVLSASLRFAVTMRIVGSNPAKEVERPKGGSLIEPRALTEDECKHLLDVAKDDWYYPVYVTALQTGMRMGELFGLYWDDVDFERKVIMVRRAAKKMRGGWGIGELKTKASYRTISISDYLVDVLEAHQEEQEESFGEINLVFTNGVGSLIYPTNFRRDSWHPLREKAGFDGLRFHDLRHTHATLLLMAGVPPKAVQARLGHSTIQMTMDTYGHLLPGIDEQAVEVLDDIFAS